MLMTCLAAIVGGQCDAEVASYISLVVEPEEGDTAFNMDMLLDEQLSTWISIVGSGMPEALEAQLRGT